MGLLTSSVIPKAVGYNYTQSAPASTWVITHNLNLASGPVMDIAVYVNSVLTKIIPNSVTIDNANQVTVTFTKPYAGIARCI